MLIHALSCIAACMFIIFGTSCVFSINIEPLPPFSINFLKEVQDFDDVIEPNGGQPNQQSLVNKKMQEAGAAAAAPQKGGGTLGAATTRAPESLKRESAPKITGNNSTKNNRNNNSSNNKHIKKPKQKTNGAAIDPIKPKRRGYAARKKTKKHKKHKNERSLLDMKQDIEKLFDANILRFQRNQEPDGPIVMDDNDENAVNVKELEKQIEVVDHILDPYEDAFNSSSSGPCVESDNTSSEQSEHSENKENVGKRSQSRNPSENVEHHSKIQQRHRTGANKRQLGLLLDEDVRKLNRFMRKRQKLAETPSQTEKIATSSLTATGTPATSNPIEAPKLIQQPAPSGPGQIQIVPSQNIQTNTVQSKPQDQQQQKDVSMTVNNSNKKVDLKPQLEKIKQELDQIGRIFVQRLFKNKYRSCQELDEDSSGEPRKLDDQNCAGQININRGPPVDVQNSLPPLNNNMDIPNTDDNNILGLSDAVGQTSDCSIPNNLGNLDNEKFDVNNNISSSDTSNCNLNVETFKNDEKINTDDINNNINNSDNSNCNLNADTSKNDDSYNFNDMKNLLDSLETMETTQAISLGDTNNCANMDTSSEQFPVPETYSHQVEPGRMQEPARIPEPHPEPHQEVRVSFFKYEPIEKDQLMCNDYNEHDYINRNKISTKTQTTTSTTTATTTATTSVTTATTTTTTTTTTTEKSDERNKNKQKLGDSGLTINIFSSAAAAAAASAKPKNQGKPQESQKKVNYIALLTTSFGQEMTDVPAVKFVVMPTSGESKSSRPGEPVENGNSSGNFGNAIPGGHAYYYKPFSVHKYKKSVVKSDYLGSNIDQNGQPDVLENNFDLGDAKRLHFENSHFPILFVSTVPFKEELLNGHRERRNTDLNNELDKDGDSSSSFLENVDIGRRYTDLVVEDKDSDSFGSSENPGIDRRDTDWNKKDKDGSSLENVDVLIKSVKATLKSNNLGSSSSSSAFLPAKAALVYTNPLSGVGGGPGEGLGGEDQKSFSKLIEETNAGFSENYERNLEIPKLTNKDRTELKRSDDMEFVGEDQDNDNINKDLELQHFDLKSLLNSNANQDDSNKYIFKVNLADAFKNVQKVGPSSGVEDTSCTHDHGQEDENRHDDSETSENKNSDENGGNKSWKHGNHTAQGPVTIATTKIQVDVPVDDSQAGSGTSGAGNVAAAAAMAAVGNGGNTGLNETSVSGDSASASVGGTANNGEAPPAGVPPPPTQHPPPGQFPQKHIQTTENEKTGEGEQQWERVKGKLNGKESEQAASEPAPEGGEGAKKAGANQKGQYKYHQFSMVSANATTEIEEPYDDNTESVLDLLENSTSSNQETVITLKVNSIPPLPLKKTGSTSTTTKHSGSTSSGTTTATATPGTQQKSSEKPIGSTSSSSSSSTPHVTAVSAGSTGKVTVPSTVGTTANPCATKTVKNRSAFISKLNELQKDLRLVLEVQNILKNGAQKPSENKRRKRDLESMLPIVGTTESPTKNILLEAQNLLRQYNKNPQNEVLSLLKNPPSKRLIRKCHRAKEYRDEARIRQLGKLLLEVKSHDVGSPCFGKTDREITKRGLFKKLKKLMGGGKKGRKKRKKKKKKLKKKRKKLRNKWKQEGHFLGKSIQNSP